MTKPSLKELNQAASDRSIKRIKQLLEEEMSYAEMAATLNAENYTTIKNLPWTALNLRQVVFVLRHKEKSWYGLSARRAGLAMYVAA
jgi:hypothetical protein